MTEIKAVVFDFHDTIAYLDPPFADVLASESGVPLEIARSVVSMLEPRVDELRSADLWLARDGGVGWDWWYGEFCNLSGSTVAPQVLFRTMAARLAERESYASFPGVDRDLARLQLMRLRLGCVSNTDFDLERALQYLKLDRYFDYAATCRDLHASKPSSAFFERIGDQLGLRMSQILFVGDKAEEDAAGAARSGMTGAWIARGAKPDHIRDPGYFIVSDLSSISAVILELAGSG